MERIPEPEQLMSDDAQARAYAKADFSEPDSRFIQQFAEIFPDYGGDGLVLDLGCGPGNITLRFAQAYPQATLHGVDGSGAMLKYGRLALAQQDESTQSRIRFIEGLIPDAALPSTHYEAILSNSLLHHLPQPQALWTTITRYSQPGTRVMIGDLFRPDSPEAAQHIVETYSADEPEVLKTDFYNSLVAAFTPAEINAQLHTAGLGAFQVKTVSDRHVVVSGVIP